MTETMQVDPTSEDLVVDKTKQFKPNAGQCSQCGHYKTWEFRIANQKTGKQMPGHVTKEGFKIGDGNCLYWFNISKMNAKKVEKKVTAGPRPAGTWIQDIAGSTQVVTQAKSTRQAIQVIPSQVPEVPPQLAESDAIMVKIGPMMIKLGRKDALVAARNILEQLAAQEP
ncbi:MAG TPA: hypothetical protein VKM55_19120 [Candidatus Lokiarchaeia archaeon]|nr:hypothetical protein [Candidatus Lokiarchaeia archaeon]